MNPEMAQIEWYESGGSKFVCPCGTKNQSMFLTCLWDGTPTLDGPCLKCWTCGRIITADGAVIGKVKVKR